ncbi:hypothetical protein [Mycetocola zhujimingii]|uniref:hypothetical protein n=1 Tax=Mycetocola zhujimingii TaxID=2079792 RepID=UPI000D362847|nr:hypothetical protein [Mycetocola zhujimingii]AWB87702.1 hypothetical protein C3E77_14570 [Mycetocola zhujimingii]
MIRPRRLPAAAALVVGILAVTACTPSGASEKAGTTTVTMSPDAGLTVLADTDETAASVATSRALFETAPLVVVAPAGAAEAQNVAARTAVALGVPLLIDGPAAVPTAGDAQTEPTPPADSTDAPTPLGDELTRLDTTTAVVVGDAAGTSLDESLTVVQVEATVTAASATIGHTLTEPASADPATFAAEIAALEATTATEATDTTDAGGTSTPSDDIPALDRPAPIDDTVAIAIDGAAQLASIATARSAGIPVHLLTGGSANPQANASVIDALHASKTDKTLAIGAAFGAEPALDWKVRTAHSGTQLPGGGQLLFENHQFVAIYGTPTTSVLGVLGEQDAAGSVERARQVAAPFQALTPKTVVPMFEIIASVAAGGPGDDGNFSNELSPESLKPWIDAAADAGIYVVIDLQPGRTDFLTQAKQYQSLLELPNVGLALDPEWRLAPDQRHLHDIGSVSAEEVNSVTHWLADLTNEKGLPQKMLVVHQFRPSMLTDREALDLSRPEIGMLLHVDGQGGQPDKQATWANIKRDAPAGVAWGWKNFYDEDTPMLTPEQTMSRVHPTPELITYQ